MRQTTESKIVSNNAVLRSLRKLVVTASVIVGLSACSLGGSQPVGFQSRINVAERMLIAGQLDSGYNLLSEVAADHSKSADANVAIGTAYFNSHALMKAETSFRLATRNGNSAEGQLGLGRVALARNDADNAIVIFYDILSRQPDNLRAMNGIGVAYDISGEHGRARQQYENVLRVDPANIDALNNLALSHAISGTGSKAVQILTELTESELTNTNLRQNLALAYFAAGREDEAYRLASADLTKEHAEQTFRAIQIYRANTR